MHQAVLKTNHDNPNPQFLIHLEIFILWIIKNVWRYQMGDQKP